jgi:hypothetical protein
MPKITGIREVQRALKKVAGASIGEGVVVGFTQAYAIFVHEDTEAAHNVGNAHFLLGPANRMKGELATIVSAVTKSSGSVEKGLLTAGLRLQREAQGETPIDTGALRASAFTAKESDLEEASLAANQAGEVIRQRALSKRNKKKKKGTK